MSGAPPLAERPGIARAAEPPLPGFIRPGRFHGTAVLVAGPRVTRATMQLMSSVEPALRAA